MYGPSNFLAWTHQQIPIAITAEGANILTRCLIIFDQAFFGHVSFIFANVARTLLGGLSAGIFLIAPKVALVELRHFYRAVNRLSTAFALLSDASMFVLGDSLKFRERISARLGDALSQLYLASSVLKRYEDDGRQSDDLPYVHWAAQDALHQAQEVYLAVLANYPNRALALMLWLWVFPFGRSYHQPSDALDSTLARVMQTDGASRDRALIVDIYFPSHTHVPTSYGEIAFKLIMQVNTIEMRLKQMIKEEILALIPQSLIAMQNWIAAVATGGFITPEENQILSDFAYCGDTSVQVDDFPQD